MAKSKKEDLFEEVVEEVKEDTSISRDSEEWNDYVLSLFTDDEKIIEDDKTVVHVHGLRRVARLLLGPTSFSGPTQVFPSTDPSTPGRATVVYTITFMSGESYSEVADCWHGNTDDGFLVYTVAMASTRAEARALRKALNIKAVSLEEITKKDVKQIAQTTSKAASANKPTDGDTSQEKATDPQMNLIDSLCQRNKIDKDKFFSKELDIRSDGFVSKSTASKAIDLLQAFFKKVEEIPEDIKAR